MTPIGVYIHIPFCEQKCLYCDFNSGPASEMIKAQYMDSLVQEVLLYKEIFKKRKIKTLFIGGGTPSSVPPSLFEPLLKTLAEVIDFNHVEEFTIECNPGTVDQEKLSLYHTYGINRISFGVQSFNNRLLKRIGRLHSRDEAIASIKLAQQVGFKHINIDLMHNLPDMTADDLYESISMADSLGVEHISLYSLILEEGTPLLREFESTGLSLMSEEEERQVFHNALVLLKEKGYGRYEVSNFAKEGRACQHNLIYWKVEDYIGLGVSAHGKYEYTRYDNTPSIASYIEMIGQNNFPIKEKEILSQEDEAFEAIMLGLRLGCGIDLGWYTRRFGLDMETTYATIIKKQMHLGTLLIEDNHLKLTEYGHDISNSVIVEFME